MGESKAGSRSSSPSGQTRPPSYSIESWTGANGEIGWLLEPRRGDALDDEPLEDKDDDDHRDGREEGADEHPVGVCSEFMPEAGEPQRQRPQRRSVQHQERPEEVIPLTLEAEDGQRRDGRGRERQNDRPEDGPLACAVNDRGLFQLAGNGFHKLRHEEYAGGGRNVREDDRRVGVNQPEFAQDDVFGDHRYLERDHQRRKYSQEQDISPGKLEPRKGIAGHGAEEDVENHDRRREAQAVEEPAREKWEELGDLQVVVKVPDLG